MHSALDSATLRKVDTALLNGIPVPLQNPGAQGRVSFVMGAHIEAPDFHAITSSPQVNVNIEYNYPVAYRRLSRLGLVLVLGWWLLYIGWEGIYMNRGASLELTLRHYYADNNFGFIEWLVLLWAICVIFCVCIYVGVHSHFYLHYPKQSVQPLSRREVRYVLGSTGFSVTLWFCFLLGLVVVAIKDVVDANGMFFYTFGYFCAGITSVVYIGGAMLASRYISKTSIPIKYGFIASFVLSSGVFANLVAAVLNTVIIKKVLPCLAPTCSIARDLNGDRTPNTAVCAFSKWLQWTLTAGLNEEVLKFLVLARLRSSLDHVVSSCWLTRCLRSSSTPGLPCCACFLKLATSPMAVVLAGMASGAGFAFFENFTIITRIQSEMDAGGGPRPALLQQSHVWFRIFAASGHICMTGTCSVALAYEMFINPSAWWVKYVALATMATLHGTINTSIFWGKSSYVEMLIALANVQFLLCWFWSRCYLEPEHQRRQSLRTQHSWDTPVRNDSESQVVEISRSRCQETDG